MPELVRKVCSNAACPIVYPTVKRSGMLCRYCMSRAKQCGVCRTYFMSIGQREHHTANAERLCMGDGSA